MITTPFDFPAIFIPCPSGRRSPDNVESYRDSGQATYAAALARAIAAMNRPRTPTAEAAAPSPRIPGE